MRAAVGRSGGRAVGVAVALLTAGPPVRLSAQTGSLVAVLPGSARTAGMGGAGAAMVGDAGAIFANPAGLATVRHLAIEGSYEAYPTGVTSAAPFTAGASVELGGGRLHLDYAYRADDALGARHRMGLRWMP